MTLSSCGEADQIASMYFGLGFLVDLADLAGKGWFDGGPVLLIGCFVDSGV